MKYLLGIIVTIIGLLCEVLGSIFLSYNLALVGLIMFGNTAFLVGVALIVLAKMED